MIVLWRASDHCNLACPFALTTSSSATSGAVRSDRLPRSISVQEKGYGCLRILDNSTPREIGIETPQVVHEQMEQAGMMELRGSGERVVRL